MSAPAHPEPLTVLKHRLQGRSRRFTGPRQAVLEALRRQRRPVTIKEIFETLPPHRCDLATIYRSLHLLEELGMVRRLDLGEGRARFEWEQRIAARNGYRQVTHRLEFFGLCPRCQ
jgi:Fur family ferric uptake transcriptional regulator